MKFHIAESIPLGLNLSTEMTVYQAMYDVITSAKSNLSIACMYMTLDEGSSIDGGGDGQSVYNAIVAAAKRGVKVRIAKVTHPQTNKSLVVVQCSTKAMHRFEKFFCKRPK